MPTIAISELKLRMIWFLIPLAILYSCRQNESKQRSFDFTFKIVCESYQLNSHFILEKNIFLNGLWCPSGINYTDTVFRVKRMQKKNRDEWTPPEAVNLYNLIEYSDLIIGSGYYPLQTVYHPGTIKMKLIGCDFVGYDTLHFVILGDKIKKYSYLKDLFRETGIDSTVVHQGKKLLNK